MALHGGSVTATSEGPGHGSEFTIRLPRAQEHAAPRPPRPPPSRTPRTPTRVLVVDDNVDGAELLKEWLELHGHEVETANDAHHRPRRRGALPPAGRAAGHRPARD